jgi:hypothetical protein
MNRDTGNPRTRWQETVLKLLNIEMGFCSIQSLSWKKKWLGKWERRRNWQNENPYRQSQNENT